MSANSSETRTPIRRLLVAVFPSAKPRTRAGRLILLTVLRLVYRIADWVAHNTETAMIELEG